MADTAKSALFTSDGGPVQLVPDPAGTGEVVANLSRCLNWLDEAAIALERPSLDAPTRAFYLRELPLVTQDTRELVGVLLRNTASAITSNDNH